MTPVQRRCVKTRAALGVNRVDGRIVRCPTGSGSSIPMAQTGLSGTECVTPAPLEATDRPCCYWRAPDLSAWRPESCFIVDCGT